VSWGPGLLENDVAADARLSFDEVLEGGGSVDEAVNTVMHEWEDDLDGDDRASLVLALAWLASEKSEVPDWLDEAAREIIDGQAASQTWEDTPEIAERRAAEDLLIAVLDGTTPHPGRIGKLLPGSMS
jgi:hypothetical protein